MIKMVILTYCNNVMNLSTCRFAFARMIHLTMFAMCVYVDVHQGKTTLENCVLQCETTGITVRTSAELLMKNSDLYGAKV